MTREELQQRAEEDEELYQQFASQFEANHQGEFVAIALDGRMILDRNQITVLERALREFGSGNFAFRKIGARALGRWRTRFAAKNDCLGWGS